MKRTPLLNRHLCKMVASLGDGDEILIVGARFATPRGIEVVDLAISFGIPTIADVLRALNHDLSVRSVGLAAECTPIFVASLAPVWQNWTELQGASIRQTRLCQDQFEDRAAAVKCVVRTGEDTAFCDVLLGCGGAA